jgi:hypothetical protein
MRIRGFLHRECDLMSNVWLCLVAAGALLFSIGNASAVDDTFPPVPKFGEPPPVADFSDYPWLHPRMGYSRRIVPVSRLCRIDIGTTCWLRQYEPVGVDCGCPPAVDGAPIGIGTVSRN